MIIVSEDIKEMTAEIFDNCGAFRLTTLDRCKNKTFHVKDRRMWDIEENRTITLKRTEYFGIQFTYNNGIVSFVPMDKAECTRKHQIRETAHQMHFLQNNVVVSNRKMDDFIKELKAEDEEYQEINMKFPYYTESDETFIFLFPKDKSEKNYVGYERCDALIYDTCYHTYYKVKTMGNGFTEVFSNNVLCRSGMAEGGFITRLRESCIIDVDNSMIYLLPVEAEIKPKFTEEELEEALQLVYGFTLKQ